MRADLTSVQESFVQALIDVNQIDAALPLFKGNAALNRERFALYRGNVSAIWQQTCASAYPVLQQLLGPDFFSDVSRMYGYTHPSRSGNLAEFGDAMADFVGSLDSCCDYPYLGDVARLEWLVHSAYYQAHETAVTLNDLAAVPPEQLGEVRCRLQPSCALLQSSWAIAEIWTAHQAEVVILPPQLEQPTCCLIWRSDWQSSWQVEVSSISAASYAALTALQDGATLGNAVEAALATDPAFAVQSELADWLQKQLITSISI